MINHIFYIWYCLHTHTILQLSGLYLGQPGSADTRRYNLPSSGFSGAICKMKITQADTPAIQMDCHPIQTNWCPHFCNTHHFYARCHSWHNPPNLSWLEAGTKYAGLHTRWLIMVISHPLSASSIYYNPWHPPC